MQTLLQTKLFRPRPTQNLVVRPRLVEALNRGLACKLTLISAPAGYGKTTLLSTWLNQVTRSVAWLSLDEEDNDPARFLDYIIAAMQSAAPGFGETIASLRGISSPVSVEAVLTRFINEITGFGEDFLLALDDYHVISDAGVHHAVMILLENLPPNLHIAIASRSDPPLRIPSLRVKGILSEIRARDLSFTQKEASEFFNAVRQMALNAGEIKTMLAKTEGWAAGLQLAAISLQNYPDRRDFMRAFAGDDRHVADYLFDEVLRNLSENIQTFLVETSILEQLCAELCMAVTGQENSQEVLEFLEGANLFLVPLDNRRQWYRYHHLFAELLQLQLKRSIPSRISDLHAQASSWYASQDIINQAIIHAIKAGDIERVEAYVKVNTFGMLEIGESTLINRWLDSLDDQTIRDSLWLTVARGWTLMMTGNIKAGEAALKDLEALAVDPKYRADQVSHALGQIAALRAYIADLKGDPIQVEKYALEALEKLSRDDPLPVAIAAMQLATSYNRRGDTTKAEAALQDALAIIETRPYTFASIDSLCMYSKVQYLNGQLHESEKTLQKAIDISRENIARGHQRFPISGLIHVYLGVLLYEWNQLDQALSEIKLGLKILENCGYTECVIVGLINLTMIHHTRGETEFALGTIGKAKQISSDIPYWYARVIATETCFKALYGDTHLALEWLAVQETDLGEPVELHRGLEYRCQAKMYRILVQPEKAAGILRWFIQTTKTYGAVDRLIRALVLQAVVLTDLDKEEEAFDHMQRAIALAEPGGYVRVFLDEGEAAARLIYRVSQSGIHPAYCQRLLEAFSREMPDQNDTRERTGTLVEPLSGRELEVLEHIASGATNQEIAMSLHLSLYTVKSHARNIYGKLGVKNRTEAVAKARLLGLLAQA